MKLKLLHILLLYLISLFPNNNDQEKQYIFKFSGNIEGINSGKLTILSLDGEELFSFNIENESFQVQCTLPEPKQYLIQINDAGFYCFLDGTDIKINEKYKNLNTSSIENSPSNDLYESYYKMMQENLNREINNELAVYREALQKDDHQKADEVFEKVLEMEEQRFSITKEFIEKYPDNIFSAYIADVVKGDSYEKGCAYYDLLSSKNKESYYGRSLKESVEKLKTSALGAQSPDFKALTEKEEEIYLYSLLGKITVLDFWASWCGPCIQEMKYLKKLYKELEGEEIQFISISLDDSVEKWLVACEEEQIPWLSLLGEGGWKNSDIREIYGIKSIPSIILLNEKGEIVAKNVRRNALKNKILELLN